MTDTTASPVDAALGRVAVVIKVVGALWLVLLVVSFQLLGSLDRLDVAVAMAVLAGAWTVVSVGPLRRTGPTPTWLLVVDLTVTSAVIVVPPAFGEAETYVGGFPFASIVVGLAVAQRRGVTFAATVLCAATVAGIVLGGRDVGQVAIGQLLIYVLGAVALTLGIDVFRRTEARARAAESALAVAEERAATAVHLHDSVLQTLAIVQRRSTDQALKATVRRQERELRDWLFGDHRASGSPGQGGDGPGRGGPGATTARTTSLRAALEVIAEEVQSTWGVEVRVVAVGGAAVEATDQVEGLDALLAAAREAVVNAAKHAGVDVVDVFAEVDATEVRVFVRDRGVGFDPAAVPADRRGVSTSIRERMDRVGGRAVVDSEPGRGTEVVLRLPLARAARSDQ